MTMTSGVIAISTNHQKAPPHNLEAEQCVLGAMMLEEDSLVGAIEVLQPEYFYRPNHQLIFETIREMSQNGIAPDELTVSNLLQERGELEKIGDRGYISGLCNTVATVENTLHYARIVREKATRRQAILQANRLIDRAHRLDIDELVEKAQCIPEELAALQGEVAVDTQNIARALWRRRERIAEGGQAFVPSGFKDLDEMMKGGFPSGYPVVIKADTGVGKTALLLQILDQMVCDTENPQKVLLISLEMKKEDIWPRVIGSRLYRMRLVDESFDYSCLHNTGNWIKSRPEYEAIENDEAGWLIDDRESLTPDQVLTQIRHHVRVHGVTIVGIDYINLIEFENETPQEAQNFVNRLRRVAKEHRLVVFVLTQIDTKSAREGRLRDSTAGVFYFTTLPKAAAVMLSIRRKDEGKEAAIGILKNRFGIKGQREYIFHGGVQTFVRPLH